MIETKERTFTRKRLKSMKSMTSHAMSLSDGPLSMSFRLPTRFRALDERISRTVGRRGHEPADQDGSSCLLLAAIDQAEEQGFSLGLDAAGLRRLVRAWLEEWKTLVIDSDWNRSGRDEIGLLCNAGMCGRTRRRIASAEVSGVPIAIFLGGVEREE